MGIEFGLGRFDDRRLEKGGRLCMRPWLSVLVRASGASLAAGPRKCGSPVFSATPA
jgi:hypothetical protein